MNRILWIDLIKVFATFCVIILHSAAPISHEFAKIDMTYWHIGTLYESSVRMAVPLFFMITGVLLLSRNEDSLSVFFRKRLMKVVIPLFVWSLIYILFKKYYLHDELNILIQLTKSLVAPRFYHLWFLYTLIGIYLFVPILRIFINNSSKNIQFYFLILWILSVSVYPLISKFSGYEIPNYLPMMSGHFGYLVMGYYLSKMKISKQMFYWAIVFIFVSTLTTFLGTSYLSFEAGPGQTIHFFKSSLSISTVVQAISYFIVIKSIGEKIKVDNIKSKFIISNISNASFGIYLVHPIMLFLLMDVGIYALNGNNPLLVVPITAIMAFIMSFAVIYIMQKIPILKKVVP